MPEGPVETVGSTITDTLVVGEPAEVERLPESGSTANVVEESGAPGVVAVPDAVGKVPADAVGRSE